MNKLSNEEEFDYISSIIEELSADDLNKIANELTISEEVHIGDKIFRYKDGDIVFSKIKETINTRKKQKMLKLIDDKSLEEFILGSFYEIIDEKNEFYIVKNEFGQKRTLNKKRFTVVEVFMEK